MLSRLQRLPAAFWLALLFCVLKGVRLSVLSAYSRMLDCSGCLEYTAFWRELELFLWLVCADLAGRRYFPRGAGWVRGAVVVALLVSALDLWVQKNFLVRLDWREAQKFWGELDSAAFFLRLLGNQGWEMVAGATAATLVFLGVAGWYVWQPMVYPRWGLPAGVSLLLLCVLLRPAPPFHEVHLRHAVAAFFDPPSVGRAYAASWVENNTARLSKTVAPSLCVQPKRSYVKPPSKVVMVVVESLSNYQSQAYGGIHDWTPQLDRWAAKGRQFTHFLANGKTTEDGLFALLTGQMPIVQNGRSTMYASELVASRPTLPQVLAKAGYHTGFMTSGNLSFMEKQGWLEKIGFQMISGHDAPFYDGMQRYHFDAPWDEALYEHARQWMGQQEAAYFLVLETVSSHQPYFDPIAKKTSIEGAFRYADAALGDFLDTLEQEDFFSDGLVVVTSDHRAMVPTSLQERQQMGEALFSRVPLLILGGSVSVGQERRAFSQQDLLPSLQYGLAQEETCLYPGQGVWSTPEALPAQCIFAVQAPVPSSEFLYCGNKTFEVRLDGEETQYVGAPGLPNYLDAIHAQRLAVGR